MNGMVDSRVVEMHFDNSDFMDKINETIIALERLNDQISSINSTQGLSNLTSGADVGLSNVENSLGNIESRFSILGIVGMTIVQRLTNAAIDSIQKVSSLLGAAARQAKQGGFMRAENIEQAKFLLEGLKAPVEEVFDRVDKAVTGTAYGIDEAAKAASSFYASGITDLDKLQDSLRAVAGVAAMTGSDFASIADIFTTVAGQGKVMTMQLRMMEGRGLNAAATMRDFINNVIEHGDKFNDSIRKNVQELTGGTKVSEESVREFVNKGKIDFELFSEAMDNAFGKHAQAANKTFSGSLSNLKTSLSRLGEAFYTPAMKAAIPVFNRLREAISSFTTDLKTSKASQEIDKIVESIKKTKKVTDKQATKLFDLGLSDIDWDIIKYFNGVNDGSIKASKSVTKAIKEITGGAKIAEDDLQMLYESGKISSDVFLAAMEDIIEKEKEFQNQSTVVGLFAKNIQDITGAISTFIANFEQSEIISNIADTIYNSFSLLINIKRAIKSAFKEVFPGSAISSMEKFSKKLSEISKTLLDKFLIKGYEPFKNIMVGFFSAISAGINIISGFGKVLSSLISTIFGLTGRVGGLSEAFRNLMEGLDKKTGTIGIFEKLSKLLDGIGQLGNKVFDKFANGIGKVINAISEGIGSIDSMDKALGATMFLFGALFSQKQIRKIMSWSNRTSKEFVSLWKMFDLGRGYDKDGNKRYLITSDFTDVLKNTTRLLKQMTLEVNTKIVQRIAISVLALAVALKMLETVDASKLEGSLNAITVLMGEMTLVMAAMITLLNGSEFTGTIKGIVALGGVTNALIKLGASMILMAIALKMISELDPQDLAKGLAAITIILGEVLGFILLLDRYQKTALDDKAAATITAIALSLLIMSKAVQTLSALNPYELAKGLGSVVVLLGAIFGFMAGVSKLGVSGGGGMIAAGIGMIAIAAAINVLVPAISKLGGMPLEQLANGLEAVIAAIIAMAVASDMASLSGGAGIFLLALGLASLATSIQRLGSMDIATLAKGITAIAIALGLLVGAGAIISAFPLIADGLMALSLAMLAAGAATALFGAGLVMIGLGLTSISAGILSFTTVTGIALKAFVETIQYTIIAILQMVPNIAVALAKGLVLFLEQIAKLAPKVTEAATTIIHSFIDAINNNVPDLIDTGINIILKLLDGISKVMSKITATATKIIAEFINGVASNLDLIIQAGMNLIISFINGLAEGIRNSKEAIKGAIVNLCEAILEAFMSFFGISSPSTVMEQQGGFLMQGLLNGIKSVGGIPAALLGAVKNGLGRLGGYITKFKQKGSEIIKNIGAGIKGKASDIKTKVGDAVTKAKTKVGEYAGKFKDAGGDLVSGIKKGIENGRSKVISAAGSIAEKALNKFKKKLGIGSPSKVFAAEARWIPEGVAVGINKTANKVQKAVESMTVSAIDPLSQAVSRAYSYLESDGDFNPTITPVLDLSEVRRDAGGIGSIFGTETVSLASSIGQNDIQNIQNNNLMSQLLTKMDKIMNSDKQNPANITNHFTVNGNDDPEQFVNTFVRTLDREMKMRAV